MMHGHEKSDDAIVAMKPTNKAERSAAEPVEPRAEAEGKAGQQGTHRAQYRVRVTQALDRMRQMIAVGTRGRSRMRESCTYGSVRGALSNERPYRNRQTAQVHCSIMTLRSSAAGQSRRRPHVIRQSIVRKKRTSPAPVRWFDSENLLGRFATRSR